MTLKRQTEKIFRALQTYSTPEHFFKEILLNYNLNSSLFLYTYYFFQINKLYVDRNEIHEFTKYLSERKVLFHSDVCRENGNGAVCHRSVRAEDEWEWRGVAGTQKQSKIGWIKDDNITHFSDLIEKCYIILYDILLQIVSKKNILKIR